MTNRGAPNGFTMIETLAVLLLTGVLVSAMTIITGQWLRSWNRGAANLQRVELLDVGIDRIALDLGSAIAMQPLGGADAPAFVGNETTVRFVHPPFDRGAPRGLEIVEFHRADDGALMRTRAQYSLDDSLLDVELGDAATVLRPPYVATFAYMDDKGKWQPEWRSASPPSSIRLSMKGVEGLPPATTVIPVLAPFAAGCVSAKTFSACQSLMQGQQAASDGQRTVQEQQGGSGLRSRERD